MYEKIFALQKIGNVAQIDSQTSKKKEHKHCVLFFIKNISSDGYKKSVPIDLTRVQKLKHDKFYRF